MQEPKISIITVVFNSEKLIHYTLKSVCEQTYKNVEYIIIDGASTDNTLAIISKYKNQVTKLVSEKDKGLYDAMNKALGIATGEYILFLNSGDELVNNQTLQNIFINHKPTIDVYYSDTLIINEQRNIIANRRLSAPEDITWKHLQYGMNVCHQSFIAKRSLADNYDLNSKYNADFDWVIRVLKKAVHTQKVGEPISKFLEGGLSRKHLLKGLHERFLNMVTHFGLFKTIINHVYITLRFIVDVFLLRKNIT